MKRMSVALVVLLAGCQLMATGTPPTSGQQSWKSASASLSSPVLPSGAKKGQPVLLKATLSLGSSSCNKDGKMTAKVDEASRKITLSGTKQTLTGENLRCTRDLASAVVEATITPESVGTYALTLEGEKTSQPHVLEVGE